MARELILDGSLQHRIVVGVWTLERNAAAEYLKRVELLHFLQL